ncbi:MAG: hypothetical protein ACI8ZO_001154 [Flavobacteriales bacterium]|jgi:hypothetical protein
MGFLFRLIALKHNLELLKLKFMKKLNQLATLAIAATALVACSGETKPIETKASNPRYEIYVPVKLKTDLSQLSATEKNMLPHLIDAAKIMDGLFWKQANMEDRETFLASIKDPNQRNFVKVNYGPWDRLDGNKPFVEGVGEKSLGANFYPVDMTVEEFEAFDHPLKKDLYTFIRRDSNGDLMCIPFFEMFKTELAEAASHLKLAAGICEEAEFKNYLNLRAEALVTDDFTKSDIAWMEMKDNGLDCIIGPIESYEDQLFGYKASYESYVLVKDKVWSKRLEHFVSFLPELQKGLPVDEAYKMEVPGTSSQLNAYDVVYYAGDCNAGSKTIAVNLPNDESIQLSHGTRRSQLKNAMEAKFEKILLPISGVLISPEQRANITFDAFFANTMFHEVAHGLGIKNTINGNGTVRESLKSYASALEEGKADILGLYMVTKLFDKGEIKEGVLMDNYVTFLASIFRSVRFGASSAHGKANMVRFNFFKEMGAFSRSDVDGTYAVDFDKMQLAMNALSEKIVTLQGDGDIAGVEALMNEMGMIDADLQSDLDRLETAGIPVDIVFEQGVDVLGLK